MKIAINGEILEVSGGGGPAGPDGNLIGTIISFMGTSAPKDYLICDGTEYNISQYQALARFFQTQFGTKNYFGGDGVSTFAVPDLRNLFLRGYHGDAETISGDIGVEQGGTIVPRYIFSGSQAVVYTDPNAAGGLTTIQNPDETLSVSNCGRHEVNYDSSGTMASNPYGFSVRPVNMAVLYCIKAIESSSIGGSSSEEVYSTEETRIGTWIDGKPLYRRVCTATSPSSVKDANQYVMSFGYDVDLVSVSGTIISSAGASVQLPSLGSAGTNCQIYAGLPDVRADGKIYMGVHHINYTSKPITFVLEYTKTTDEATS